MLSEQSLRDLPLPLYNLGVDSKTSEDVVVLTELDPSDPTRPDNWNTQKKLLVVAAGVLLDFSSCLGSSLPSNVMEYIGREFDIHDEMQLALPISVYVIGFIVGPMLYGPLSETFGRKPLLLWPFLAFVLLAPGSALAVDWPMFLTFRCLRGLMASAPIAIIGGLFADIFTDAKQRGRYLTYFIAASGFGPCLGPMIGGAIGEHSNWRWTFWLSMILGGVTLPLVICMPETYQPVVLKRRAAELRKVTGSENIKTNCVADLQKPHEIIMVVLARPFKLLFTEAIVFFSCLYLALIYGIFYLTFEAWSEGFGEVYGMRPFHEGLTYLPFGAGNILAVLIFLWYDNYLTRAQAQNAAWSFKPEFRRLPLACIGGPLWSIALFWIGWTVREDINPAVPIASGVFLGAGFLLVFIALLNYLSDAYTIYSASAQSISSTTRSVLGAVLPIAADPLFKKIGFSWACTLLGLLSTAMIAIPFAFIIWGDRLRANSKFGQKMAMLRESGNEMKATMLDDNDSVFSLSTTDSRHDRPNVLTTWAMNNGMLPPTDESTSEEKNVSVVLTQEC